MTLVLGRQAQARDGPLDVPILCRSRRNVEALPAPAKRPPRRRAEATEYP